jgi:hypothetical protein
MNNLYSQNATFGNRNILNLSATSSTITNLYTSNFTSNNLYINNSTIDNLSIINNGTITSLYATSGTISTLNINQSLNIGNTILKSNANASTTFILPSNMGSKGQILSLSNNLGTTSWIPQTTWLQNGNNIYNNYYVGIGNNIPQYSLDIATSSTHPCININNGTSGNNAININNGINGNGSIFNGGNYLGVGYNMTPTAYSSLYSTPSSVNANGSAILIGQNNLIISSSASSIILDNTNGITLQSPSIQFNTPIININSSKLSGNVISGLHITINSISRLYSSLSDGVYFLYITGKKSSPFDPFNPPTLTGTYIIDIFNNSISSLISLPTGYTINLNTNNLSITAHTNCTIDCNLIRYI